MRGVIRFVKYQLRVHLKDNPKLFSAFPDMELHMHQPLEIETAQSDNDLLSYKTPWTRSLTAVSLASTDMYEAGGNIFLVNPLVDGEDEKICAGEVNSWDHVNTMADVFRLGGQEGASTPLDGGLIAKCKRLKFTVSFAVHAAKADVFAQHDHVASSLKLVTGHVALWGWYLAALEALDAGNTKLVAILWQAALIATIQAHLITDVSSSVDVEQQRPLHQRQDHDGFLSRFRPQAACGHDEAVRCFEAFDHRDPLGILQQEEYPIQLRSGAQNAVDRCRQVR
jgi:hypothetical protein